VSGEVKELIFRMVAENSTWGAPRIHGELKMLGFDLSERTVLCRMRKAPRRSPEPAKRWAAFLAKHREAIAAMENYSLLSEVTTSPFLRYNFQVANLSLSEHYQAHGRWLVAPFQLVGNPARLSCAIVCRHISVLQGMFQAPNLLENDLLPYFKSRTRRARRRVVYGSCLSA
jgi:hypothetical protein